MENCYPGFNLLLVNALARIGFDGYVRHFSRSLSLLHTCTDQLDHHVPLCFFKGQCFIIDYDGKEIGQINHNKINHTEKSTDLDIWLNDESHTGKGYGPQAIGVMCNYLYRQFGCRKFFIAPSRRNTRAIRAYEKAGFVLTELQTDDSQMDYDDNVIMVKTIEGDYPI